MVRPDPITELLEAAMREHAPDGLIDPALAARVAAATIRRLPDGPWMPVLRLRHDPDERDHLLAARLSEGLQQRYGTGPLLVLGEGAELADLDDDDLVQLGLTRTVPDGGPD